MLLCVFCMYQDITLIHIYIAFDLDNYQCLKVLIRGNSWGGRNLNMNTQRLNSSMLTVANDHSHPGETNLHISSHIGALLRSNHEPFSTRHSECPETTLLTSDALRLAVLSDNCFSCSRVTWSDWSPWCSFCARTSSSSASRPFILRCTCAFSRDNTRRRWASLLPPACCFVINNSRSRLRLVTWWQKRAAATQWWQGHRVNLQDYDRVVC